MEHGAHILRSYSLFIKSELTCACGTVHAARRRRISLAIGRRAARRARVRRGGVGDVDERGTRAYGSPRCAFYHLLSFILFILMIPLEGPFWAWKVGAGSTSVRAAVVGDGEPQSVQGKRPSESSRREPER